MQLTNLNCLTSFKQSSCNITPHILVAPYQTTCYHGVFCGQTQLVHLPLLFHFTPRLINVFQQSIKVLLSVGVDSLQDNMYPPDLYNSCPLNSEPDFGVPFIKDLKSRAQDHSVDFIHNIYCVDIVHYNTVDLLFPLWLTCMLSSTQSLHLQTCEFWYVFTCNPLLELLT